VISVDEGSFFLIIVLAVVAGVIATVLPRKFAPPVIVIELILGIIVGPQVLGWVEMDSFTDFFRNLGLGMLFFFAGYEIDFERIKGKPLKLGVLAWLLSVLIAFGAGGLLETGGLVLSFLFTGAAMTSTSLGALIPILKDAGESRTKFGTLTIAAAACAEFGPILLLTLVLSKSKPWDQAIVLLTFLLIAVVISVASVRASWKSWPLLERTLNLSSQLAVRITVLLIFALVFLAQGLGLDVLLGGFVAGMIVRASLRGRETEAFESKVYAIGFGLLIPFFFISSGIAFDLDALTGSTSALIKLPIFLVLMVLARGLPALLLYRGDLKAKQRQALALLSATQLPLVVAIATIGVEGGHMRPSTAAALVGAAVLTMLFFPVFGLNLLRSGDKSGSGKGKKSKPRRTAAARKASA
jgi:Kef-type K+ transport system membrane component KefB